MNKFREAGKIFGSGMNAVKEIDFSVSERNAMALFLLHFSYFEEFQEGDDKDYPRGTVFRQGTSKWLMTYDGRFDISRCRLFRDAGRYPWVREEFVIKGCEREYEGVWYRVKVDVVGAGATPPPNSNEWERIE